MGTHRNTGKKGSVLGPDYMANFSPASETNPLKIKLYLARGAIQRELKSAFSNRARIFSPAKWARKSEKISYFSPGWKVIGHSRWFCFQDTSWLPLRRKEKRFQWNEGDKIENLIRCLASFKAWMEYKNIDFNADKVKQYEAVREAKNLASFEDIFSFDLCK